VRVPSVPLASSHHARKKAGHEKPILKLIATHVPPLAGRQQDVICRSAPDPGLSSDMRALHGTMCHEKLLYHSYSFTIQGFVQSIVHVN
jgi:hypothetical protein